MDFLENKKAQAGVGLVFLFSIVGLVSWLILSKERAPEVRPHQEEDPSTALDYREAALTSLQEAAQAKVESACISILEDFRDDEKLKGITAEQLNVTYEKYLHEQLKLNKERADVAQNYAKALAKLMPPKNPLASKVNNSNDTTLEDTAAIAVAEAKYYEQKGQIVQALKAAIEAYDSTAFTNNVTALTQLRTNYTRADNDPITTSRIPSAAPESIKTMLASCLNNEVIQKHAALFTTPPLNPFPEEKLNAIVGIREALGLNAYNPKHFKTAAEYENYLLCIRSEKYYKAKEILLLGLRADIEDYNSIKFVKDLQFLVTLRTDFTDNDNDPNVAVRISAATEEATKAMLATLLKTEIIQKHEAFFNPPAAVFPEKKLAAIVAIREAIGLINFTGSKQSKTLHDYRVALRSEAFDHFIATLQNPSAVLVDAKTALFTAVSSAGSLNEDSVLTLPYHLAVIEEEDATIDNNVLFIGLSMYLLPLARFIFSDGQYIFNRTSPAYKLDTFRKACHHFHPAQKAAVEEDLLNFVAHMYHSLNNNYDVFTRKIAYLSLNKRLIDAEQFILGRDVDNLLGSSAESKKPPSYEFFLNCVNALYPESKGEVMIGRYGCVISNQSEYKQEIAKRTLETYFMKNLLSASATSLVDIDRYTRRITKVLVEKRLNLKNSIIRSRLVKLFFKYDDASIPIFLTTKTVVQNHLTQLKKLLKVRLTRYSYEGFTYYFLLFEGICRNQGKAAEQQALNQEIVKTLTPMYATALKSLSRENAMKIHFVHSIFALLAIQTRIHHRGRSSESLKFSVGPSSGFSVLETNIKEIINPYFSEAQESWVNKGEIDLEKDPLYPTLQLAMRYYLKQPWDLASIAKYMITVTPITKNEPGLRLLAKHNYLPKLVDFITNEKNYTDSQLSDEVITEFFTISEELKNGACFLEVLSEISAKVITPFWLIQATTTPTEFRALCNVKPEDKARIVTDVQAKINSFVVLPTRAPLAPICQRHIELLSNIA